MNAIPRTLLAVLLLFGLAAPAFAAARTVTLKVDNMTCVSCPYIVDMALTRVPGVTAVQVSFEDKTATVTFDDARADIAELTQATRNAGFPSQLQQPRQPED